MSSTPLLVISTLQCPGSSVKAVVKDGLLVAVPSPMDLELGAHMDVVKGRDANVELKKAFYKAMITMKEGRLVHTRSIFRLVATESLEQVQEQMNLFGSQTLVWMGHTAANYKVIECKLPHNLKNLVSNIKKLLPKAKIGNNQDGDVEVFFDSKDPVQEAVHVGTRLSYHIFIIWNLVFIASQRTDYAKGEKELMFDELLLKHRREHNKLVNNAQISAAAGLNNTEFDKIMESRSQIDEKWLQLVMEDLANRDQDEVLYHLGQITDGRGFDNSLYAAKPEVDCNSGDHSSKHGGATSSDGFREFVAEVPVLMMKVEGSWYEGSTEKQRLGSDRSLIVLPLLSMVARLSIQMQVSMSFEPSSIKFELGIKQVNAGFDGKMHNSVEGKKRMGPFFSQISFSVVPVNHMVSIGSVTMNRDSPNTLMKFGVSDQCNLMLGVNFSTAPEAVVNLTTVKGTTLEFEETPWQVRQVSVESGKGGSCTMALSYLHGNRFDPLNPTANIKKSILLWGNEIPVLQLPFTSDGGINFSTTDNFTWRFPKVVQDTSQEFRIEGKMYITYINPQMVWETRMKPFEWKLEQKLAP